ncbi:MAG: FixH family protein [Proteobacteria bacterium]|nr:FixH family protein [Pseudomonadota bacterium]
MRAALALGLVAALPAMACDAPSAGWSRAESASTIAWLRPQPPKPGVGAEFALEAKLCARSGALPAAVRFDAWMPAHRHGMNTRPVAARRADGTWRVEGFLFHMPGAWQFVIETDAAAGRERLTLDTTVD